MARSVRGCLTPWPQQEEAREPETNVSLSQQGDKKAPPEAKK